MCGITGFIDFRSASDTAVLKRMQNALAHRGPNDRGEVMYEESNCVVGLAQTRLSIIDISALGHQPMIFRNLTIVLNGEIYNYKSVKTELEGLGHSFTSSSDTEVVVHAFYEWGQTCVNKFIGMFAFVIYDKDTKKVFACRDRVGVKPFFYYFDDLTFLFGSELKSFHQNDHFSNRKEIDVESVGVYFRYGYVPGPRSIFLNTYKLAAGHWLVLDTVSRNVTVSPYWKLEDYYAMPLFESSYSDIKSQLKELLLSACQYRMVADVPVGIFLSGGFDSTLVASLLQHNSTSRLKTYTIGFPDGVDEGPFAARIAKHLGTDHTNYNCTEADAKEIIPELPYYYDEPNADISAIPTILVSRVAKKSVTVALSADGGDEIFAGYNGFAELERRLKSISKIPIPRVTSHALKFINRLIPHDNYSLRRRITGLAAVLDQPRGSRQIKSLIELTDGLPPMYVNGLLKQQVKNFNSFDGLSLTFNDDRNLSLYNSFKGALTDQLLVKIDRATMSCSLEGREPLLDHRLIEFGARIPYPFKHDGITSKKILRDIVYEFVPKRMIDRPKIGFDLPIYQWLRGDMKDLLATFLSEDMLKASGIFNTTEVNKMRTSFLENKMYYESSIWRMICFQMWFDKWMKN
jgi:asparagine synthase (glutamine-hydrolysing)